MTAVDIIGLIRIVVITGMTILLFRVASPALKDLFKGGPKPPSHPLPPNDTEILTKALRRDTFRHSGHQKNRVVLS
jgi:hypothetical protein